MKNIKRYVCAVGLCVISFSCAMENGKTVSSKKAVVCLNCSTISTSIQAILKDSDVNLRFYHLQSQFGEAQQRQCSCAQRTCVLTALRQHLDNHWPKVSKKILKEMQQNNQIAYYPEH